MPIALHYIGKLAYINYAGDSMAAAEMLKKLRTYIDYFASSDQAKKLVADSVCVAIGWGGDFYRARIMAKQKNKKSNFGYFSRKRWFYVLI